MGDVDHDTGSMCGKTRMKSAGIPCSIGVFAYNEEANIGFCLRSLTGQRLEGVEIREIVLVASGCTDRTVEIARNSAEGDRRIQVVVEAHRHGKASAVNLFHEHASAEICLIVSADTIAHEDMVERLVRPFSDPKVGMTGPRSVLTGEGRGFPAYLIRFRKDLQHRLSLRVPRIGECVAYRNFFGSIAVDTAVEEAYIEGLVHREGFEVRYVPDAVIRSKGPQSLRTYLLQSRRYYAGHLDLKRRLGYQVSSMRPAPMAAALAEGCKGPIRELPLKVLAVTVEVWGRVLGAFDLYVKKENPYIWKMVEDTKELVDPRK